MSDVGENARHEVGTTSPFQSSSAHQIRTCDETSPENRSDFAITAEVGLNFAVWVGQAMELLFNDGQLNFGGFPSINVVGAGNPDPKIPLRNVCRIRESLHELRSVQYRAGRFFHALAGHMVSVYFWVSAKDLKFGFHHWMEGEMNSLRSVASALLAGPPISEEI